MKNGHQDTKEPQIAHIGTLAVHATRQQLITAGSEAVKEFVNNGGRVHRFKWLVSKALAAVLEPFQPKYRTVVANPTWNYSVSQLPDPQEFMETLHGYLGLKGTAKLIGDPNQEVDCRADGLMPLISLTDLGREWEIEDPWGTGFCALSERLIAEITKVYGGEIANFLATALTENRVRVEEGTKESWIGYEAIVPATPDSVRYFLISVATGLTFNGHVYAPEDARNAVLQEGSLPLTLAHIVTILMVWPRLVSYSVRWIDAIGCELQDKSGNWRNCIFAFFGSKGLGFNEWLANSAREICGAGAAFPKAIKKSDSGNES